MPYLGFVSEKIQRIQRKKIGVGFANPNNLKSVLCKLKDPIKLPDQSGIYKIICGECGAYYEGRTSRKLKKMCQEHLSRMDSTFLQHLRKEKHENAPHEVALLAREYNHKLIQKLEPLYIELERRSGVCLNVQLEMPSSVLLSRPPPSLLVASSGPKAVALTSIIQQKVG